MGVNTPKRLGGSIQFFLNVVACMLVFGNPCRTHRFYQMIISDRNFLLSNFVTIQHAKIAEP